MCSHSDKVFGRVNCSVDYPKCSAMAALSLHGDVMQRARL